MPTPTHSNLPPIEEVQATQYMQIVRIAMDKCPVSLKRTKLYSIKDGEPPTQIEAHLYEIDDDRIRGYIPSKALIVDGDINMIFFTSPSLPPAARAFGTGKTYALMYPVEIDETVEYDVDTRMLIDQVVIGDQLVYLFLFEQAKYNEIIVTEPKEKDLYVLPGI